MSDQTATEASVESQLEDLRASIKQLQDREAIRAALQRYCTGADRSDVELMRSVYHPDAYDDHGDIFQGLGWDLAAESVARNVASDADTLHTVSNISIELDGDVAYVESYVVAYHYNRDENGIRSGYTYGGRYVDRFECRDGDWRTAHRIAVHDWSRVESGWPELAAGASFVQGRRSKEDARYVRQSS